jgi:DNA uptake protein ComE-like DNA-binding protein
MARRGNNRAHTADDWLIKPANGTSKGHEAEPDPAPADAAPEEDEAKPATSGEPASPEVSQWLIDSNGGANGRTTEVAEETEPTGVVGPGEVERIRTELERTHEDRPRPAGDTELKLRRAEQAIAERITRFEETLDEQQLRIADLEELLARREAELAEAVQERDEALKTRGSAAGEAVDERWEKREAALKERLNKRFEKREAELNKGFEQRQIELERQLEDLEEQVDIREAEVREQATQRERELSSRIEELESTLAEAQQRAIAKPARRPAPMKGGKLNLNEATFEQLRDLGLSVTLSARTISYRDSRGGFESMDELDEVPGLSTELKRVLRGQLKLS